MASNLLNRLKKVEERLTAGKTVIRFITPDNEGFIVSQSSKQSEIGLKLMDLNSIEKLSLEGSITFIENITE